MKQVTQLLTALTIVVGMMFTVGCETDPVEPIGPSIDLVSLNGADILVDTVELGENFIINISSLQGDVALTSIEVRENNVSVDASRIIFDGFGAQSNPNPLIDLANLSWDIEITADSVMETTSTYTVIVVDANAKTATASLDITTVKGGTPVTVREMILLKNAAGPVGTGGLDLETGDSSGSNDVDNPDSDLKDMGIDLALPADQNWKQLISGMNNAVVKTPAAGVVYADVATSEEVLAIFEAGMTITTSEKVAANDVFVVQTSAGNIFLISTAAVNITTGADNTDNYVFSVKN